MTVYRKKQAPTAAQDERVLATPGPNLAKPKKKVVQAPTAAQDERVLAHPGPAPSQPEPPDPYLQNYGFAGSMRQFVQRLHEATQAHFEAYGYKPSPALAFDLARAPEDVSYQHLFTRGLQEEVNVTPEQEAGRQVEEDNRLIEDYLTKVATQGRELSPAEITEENPRLAYLLETNPKARARVAMATHGFKLYKASVLPEPRFNWAKYLTTGSLQVVGGVVMGPPILAIEEGKGIKKSVEERSARPFLKTQKTLAEETAKGIWYDVTNPGENYGYLALDIFGAASILRGGAGRIQQKSVRKPRGGTIEYRKGLMVERELGSENLLVNDMQRMKAAWVNRRMKKRHDKAEAGIVEPSGPFTALIPRYLADQIDLALDNTLRTLLSGERKMGRLATARRRVERAIEEAPLRELEFVDGQAPAIQRVSMLHRRVKGLTVGEQKALQVRFSDLAGDDLAKLRQWRGFHEAMIEEAPLVVERLGLPQSYVPTFLQEHRAQLQALQVAEKVFKGKPSKRMVKAEALVRELEAEATSRKIIEFGLAPDLAEGRIAAAGDVVRTKQPRDLTQPLEQRVSPDSIYTKFEAREKSRKQTKLEQRLTAGPRVGQWWMPNQDVRRLLPELYTSFTGESIIKGDFRIDTTHLTSESVASTFRAGAKVREWQQLLKGSTSKPSQSGFDIPIATADAKGIPPKLKRVLSQVDEGYIGADEAEFLARVDDKALIEHLFPGTDPVTGKLLPSVDVENVRWVDRRMVMGLNVLPKLPDTPVNRSFQLANEIPRATTLFARPAYGLNIPSNAGMLLMQQGPWTGNNLIRGLFSEQFYGPRVTQKLNAMAGEGRNLSYVNLDIKWAPLKGSKFLAQMWNRLADSWMRRAAVIHEIQRQGYKGRKGFEEFFDKAKDKHTEVARRSQKAVIEFNNLTEFEKQTLRNVFFIYPFRSRAAVWSIRTIFEHPAKSAILADIGERGMDDIEQQVEEHVPDALQESVKKWLDKTGFMPISWNDDGTPKVINPASVNLFSTLHDTIYFWDQDAALLRDLGPGGKLLVFSATGRDEWGNELPGPRVVDAFRKIMEDLPQYRAWKRGGRAALEKPLPPIDKSSRDEIVARRRKAMKQAVLGPGWLNGWGTLISGGLTPRDLNTDAVFARFWRDLPMKQRHKIELEFLQDALQVQAKFLNRKVPKDVQDAVLLAGKFTRRKDELRQETAQERLTPRASTDVLIDLLEEEKLLDPEEASRQKGRAKKLRLKEEFDDLQAALLNRFGHQKAMRDWDEDVRSVWSFRKNIVQRKLDLLAKEGVVPKRKLTASQEQLFEAGRDYLAFTKELDRRKKMVDGEPDSVERKRMEAELRAWLEQQDKPRKNLPSFIRIAWANQSAGERAKHLRSAAFQEWKGLSGFDRELLGKKSGYGEAWLAYENAVADYKKTADYDQRSLKYDQKLDLAKQVNKYYPGFIRDFDFAHRRRFARLREFKVISESPNKRDWLMLLETAKVLAQAVDNEFVTDRDAKEQWKDYLTNQYIPWVESSNEKFNKELNVYGKKRLYGLLEKGTL